MGNSENLFIVVLEIITPETLLVTRVLSNSSRLLSVSSGEIFTKIGNFFCFPYLIHDYYLKFL